VCPVAKIGGFTAEFEEGVESIKGRSLPSSPRKTFKNVRLARFLD
jgi:hypothetical protein